MPAAATEIVHTGVLAFRAEHAVDLAVLMLGQAHIVHIGLLGLCVRQHHWMIPETEALGGAAAFSHGEEALAIHALHSNHQIIFAVQLDRAAVQRGFTPRRCIM